MQLQEEPDRSPPTMLSRLVTPARSLYAASVLGFFGITGANAADLQTAVVKIVYAQGIVAAVDHIRRKGFF
jgi:hypothetical protein